LHPWYWEGNVQSCLAAWFQSQGYTILQSADTSSREQGVDLVMRQLEGGELLVTVKGYPEKSANMQARHWFASAIFDLVVYRQERPKASLGLGLPYGFTTYANLSKKVLWLKQTLPFSFYWVSKDGEVIVE
jgi:hypothetical protein